jgi:acetyl-CoA synthetase
VPAVRRAPTPSDTGRHQPDGLTHGRSQCLRRMLRSPQPLFTAFGPSAIEQRVTATGGSNAKLIVTDAANRPKLDEVAGCPPVLQIDHGTPGAAAFALALADQPAEFAPTMRRGTDPFILIFTSGTTGHAKGVAAPLSALLQFAVFMTDGVDLQDSECSGAWPIPDGRWGCTPRWLARCCWATVP